MGGASLWGGQGRKQWVSALWLSMDSAGCLMCPNWALKEFCKPSQNIPKAVGSHAPR